MLGSTPVMGLYMGLIRGVKKLATAMTAKIIKRARPIFPKRFSLKIDQLSRIRSEKIDLAVNFMFLSGSFIALFFSTVNGEP